ncbi:MAG TPA: DNA-3-methyladenine glycosylase [Mycobacteriales bacterium]|nr:DNA-3-methyladenine glycosylase [Mycobacteriales bacterium]
MNRQPRSFFARPVLDVAADLLGCVVTTKSADGPVSVRLTEVEAYDGPNDPASHAYRGPTPRTEVMFGPPGFLYVYFTYGMHWCANLVCGPAGTASAVLLRAGEVVAGHELARTRRPACKADRDLARGPARLAGCLALRGEDSGADLCIPHAPLVVAAPLSTVEQPAVRSGPRVGISTAIDWPWRFWLDGEPTVSSYRPAVRRNRSKSTAAVRQTDRSER